jgi:hypothetical protein
MRRDVRLELRLTASEAAKLDEFRLGLSRTAYLRRLLMDVEPHQAAGIASRDEALALLSSQARDGKVAATIALVRELRGDHASVDDVPAWLRE